MKTPPHTNEGYIGTSDILAYREIKEEESKINRDTKSKTSEQ